MSLQVFSWGFWGWGTATRQLIAAADAVEKQRGFAPPVFVNIRLRRAGRAKGFRDDTFERLLGRRRYRWMPALGNANIATARRGVNIACPEAVRSLLHLALDVQERRARIIYFCACESPWARQCHRHEVTRLLQKAARRQGVGIHVQEWPGGHPPANPRDVHVSPDVLRSVARGAKAVALNRTRLPAELVGIPWGTVVRLKAGREEFLMAVGPAAFRRGTWVLPEFRADLERADDARRIRQDAARLRRGLSLDGSL